MRMDTLEALVEEGLSSSRRVAVQEHDSDFCEGQRLDQKGQEWERVTRSTCMHSQLDRKHVELWVASGQGEQEDIFMEEPTNLFSQGEKKTTTTSR